jgi:pyruvate dehydrogenase E1 component alpha subunit
MAAHLIDAKLRAFRSRVCGLEQALWRWGHNRPDGRFIHSSLGHEVTPFCVTSAIGPAARYALYYRSHAWLIAIGIAPPRIAAEIARPRPGPMHLFLHESIIDCNSIVGAQIPIAVGAALGTGQTVACVLGDGATTTGVFFEALNIAVLKRAPVLFVIEDNGVAIDSPAQDISVAPVEEKFRLFRIPILSVAASQPGDVLAAACEQAARSRSGPAALCVTTERVGAHAIAFESSAPKPSDPTLVDSEICRSTEAECLAVLQQ